VKIHTKRTGIIDLEGDFFGKFDSTVRNEIRRTFKEPALSFDFSEQISEAAYNLYCSFLKKKGSRIPSRKSLRVSHQFTASLDGKIVSAIFVYSSYPVAPLGRHRSTSFAIGMASMATSSSDVFGRWASGTGQLHRDRHGKTDMRRGSSARSGGTALIMSLCSASAVFAMCFDLTQNITIKFERTYR
jgi:hypothetical protein